MKTFQEVPVKERKPTKKDWYILTTNAVPGPCGRSWFDGKEFDLSSKCHDYKRLLQNGNDLFWLEEVEISLCKQLGHAMYSQYQFNNFEQGGKSSFGTNKCSRCGYEDPWQYDHA